MLHSSLKKKGVAIAFLFLGMSFFGSATPISKLVGGEFPIFSASLFRVVLGAISLLPFVVSDFNKISSLKKKDWISVSLIALFGMLGFTVFLIWGMKFISGVAGSIIMSLTPALTGVGAYLFMSAPLGKTRIFALCLGVAGVLVLNIFNDSFQDSGSEHFYLGCFLVFLAICCEATYSLLGKKVVDSVPPLLTSFLACVLSIPLFIGLATFDFRQESFLHADWKAWAALAWWGVATLGAGSAFWYSGLEKSEATTAAGFMAVMPLSALLLSYFLLGESFEWIHLLGAGFVLSSVGLMSFVHSRSH